MHTDALELARQAATSRQRERLTWAVIELQVTDLGRAMDFWTRALGLRVRDQDSQRAELGTEKATLFVFHVGASVPASSRYPGLYHVAMGVPEQGEFSRLLVRLIAMRVPVSPTDHLMSKAIYLADPDGLEIEIALETPERFGRFGEMSQGQVLYNADGQPHNGRERLDMDAELAHAQGADLAAPLSDGACLAHMHLKVSELEAAANWFEGVGFARNLMLRDVDFVDMGAGTAYTHRLAMNKWAGPNLRPAPTGMARLTRYALHAHDADVLANARGLLPCDAGLSGRDPTGTAMSLIPAY